MNQKPKERSFSDYIVLWIIAILFVFVEVAAFFLWYTHNPHHKCEWEREVIKETTVNLNRDENKPVWTRYTLLCKDTGEIKTREDFKS